MAAAPILAASPFDQLSSSQPVAAAHPGLQQGAEGLLQQAASQPQPSAGVPLPLCHNELVLVGQCSLPGTR